MPYDIRSLSRQWFEQVWNRGRDAAIDEMAAPDAIIHGLGEGGRRMASRDEFREFYRHFRGAFPDIHIDVEDVLVDGDKTAVRISFTGTHTGDGLGIAPTGRAVRSTGIIILRWEGDRIVEAWNEFDAAGMMHQLAGPSPVKLRA